MFSKLPCPQSHQQCSHVTCKLYFLVCCGKNNSKCCKIGRDEFKNGFKIQILLVVGLHWNAALAPFSLLIQISSAPKVTDMGTDGEVVIRAPHSCLAWVLCWNQTPGKRQMWV